MTVGDSLIDNILTVSIDFERTNHANYPPFSNVLFTPDLPPCPPSLPSGSAKGVQGSFVG
jgi:hypothetical protein